jgi:DNA adenine methylase
MGKPFLKWAGGKRRLLPEIRRLMPESLDGLSYYEPFVGGGAALFGLEPQRAFICDKNAQLALAYQAVRDCVDEVVEALREHEGKHSADHWHSVRAWDRRADFEAMPMAAKAARLIYLNKTCYNGLYRAGSKGWFNAPLGRQSNPRICDEPGLRAAGEYLASNEVHIMSGDFESLVKGVGDGCLAYFDPPYHAPGGRGFTSYQAGGFNEADHVRLRDAFAEASRNGAMCLLSNSDTPFVRELYKEYEVIGVKAGRPINSKAEGRGAVGELLIKGWK